MCILVEKVEITDKELGKILLLYSDMIIDKYYSNTPVHEFSDEFNRKMEKMIKKHFSQKTKKRVAVIMIAAVLLICGFSMSISAIREPILKFFVETYEKFSSITFGVQDDCENTILPIEKCEIGYIPDGFNLDTYMEIGDGYLWTYNDGTNYIKINQFLISDYSLNVDTENTNYSEILINGYGGITFENKGCVNIIFSDDKYCYDIFGNIEYDEIKKIAESIK